MNKYWQVRQSLKRVRDPIIRERLLIVQASYENPLMKAAKIFRCSTAKIVFWRKRYEEFGLRGLYTRAKSGRFPKINKEQAAKIRRKVKRHDQKRGWSTKRIQELIYEEAGVKYCERQVERIAQSWGLALVRPSKRYAYSKETDRERFLKKYPTVLSEAAT